MYTTNKRATESFVVAAAGATTIPVTGALYNTTTGVVNLTNGQLGIVSDSSFGSVAFNSFADATPTMAESPVIKIYQGTAASANPGNATAVYPLAVRPFEHTASIDGRSKVIITKQPFRLPRHATYVLGNTAGQGNAINIVNNEDYQITFGFRGRRVEQQFSNEQAAYLRINVATPNFTTLNLNAALATDWLTTNIAYQTNLNSSAFKASPKAISKSPIVALLLAVDDAAGTAIGGATPIAAGDTIPVINGPNGLKSLTLTEAMAESIKNSALAVAGGVIADLTWKILTTDLANAGSATGGTANMVMFVALDEQTVFLDEIADVKVDISGHLVKGFSKAVRFVKAETAYEGQCTGRQLDLWYRFTQGQQKYNQRHTDYVQPNYPSPFDISQQYVTYVIQHGSPANTGLVQTIPYVYKDIVAVPRYSSGTTAHAAIALLDTAFNSWLGSSNNGAILTLD
jgi:hypothetical protein